MREIKFRGWYGESLGMREPQFNGFVNEIFAEQTGVYMQYTGLKDKNGVEIYEGDILKFEDEGEEGYEYQEGFDFMNTAAVCFKDGRFELENFSSDNSSVFDEMQTCHEEFIRNFEFSEVVGNIYQNPELLNQ